MEALSAAGAVDAGTADEILAELRLALAVQRPGEIDETSPGPRGLSPDARMELARLMRSPPPRAATGPFTVSGLPLAYSDGLPADRVAQLAAVTSGLASLVQGAARIFEGDLSSRRSWRWTLPC